MTIETDVRSLCGVWLCGLRDGLSVHRTLFFFAKSKRITMRIAQCFLLNGFIFLGSLAATHVLIRPLLRRFGALVAWGVGCHGPGLAHGGTPLHVLPVPEAYSGALDTAASFAFHALWAVPVYVLTFILNAIWYQTIADHAFSLMRGGHGRRGGARRMARLDVTRLPVRAVVRDEIYRLFLGAWMAVEAMVLFFLPFVGKWVCFVYSTWIYSLYAFEYSWALRGLNLGQRLRYFEEHYVYFFGFGTPCALATLFFSRFVAAGMFALIFPLYIVMAAASRPFRHECRVLPKRVPILYAANQLSALSLYWSKSLLMTTPRRCVKTD